jgi:arginine/glutamate-rich protein 1
VCTVVLFSYQDEERLLMIEQRRKIEEERKALEVVQKNAEKVQQEAILNRRGTSRPKLSFGLKSK